MIFSGIRVGALGIAVFFALVACGDSRDLDQASSRTVPPKPTSFAAVTAPSQQVSPGVPFYPGSLDVPNLDTKPENGKGMIVSYRTTLDPPAKVFAYYTNLLGKPQTGSSSLDSANAIWSSSKRTVMLQVLKDGIERDFKVGVSVLADK